MYSTGDYLNNYLSLSVRDFSSLTDNQHSQSLPLDIIEDNSRLRLLGAAAEYGGESPERGIVR